METIPHLRTSERKSFKRCPQQWQWAYREGLTVRRLRPGALWFGTGIHLALAERYKYRGLRRGSQVLKVWREYVGEEVAYVRSVGGGEETPEVDWIDARELGEAMLGGYLDKHGMDPRWFVVSTEQTFEIPIPNPRHSPAHEYLEPKHLVYYNGTFDGVRLDQENDDSLWLWEWKTAATIKTSHLQLDDQAGSYWAVATDVMRAKGLKFHGSLEGIMYDFLRKAKPTADEKLDADGIKRNKPTKAHYIDTLLDAKLGLDPRILATVNLAGLEAKAAEYGIIVHGDVSKVQPTPLFAREEVWRTRSERRTQIRRIQNEALHMNAMRSGALPLYKSPGDACNQCQFMNMCELHEQGSDWEEFRDMQYTVRDPYADHRKSAAE